MGANAGGANVSGVNALESGEITFSQTATTFSNAGGETLTIDITVPAGHKWNIKHQSTSVGTFVGTLSSTQLRLTNTAVAVSLTMATGTTSSNVILNYTQPIIITSGCRIRFVVTTSAWTSGQLNCNIIYQDTTL